MLLLFRCMRHFRFYCGLKLSLLLIFMPLIAESALPDVDRIVDAVGVASNAREVFRYSLKHSSFSDYSFKVRYVVLPKGEKLGIDEQSGIVLFPDDTVIVKIFFYYALEGADCPAPNQPLLAQKRDQRLPHQGVGEACLIEVRTLTLSGGRWTPAVFVPNERQLLVPVPTGGSLNVSLYAGEMVEIFDYSIPDLGECTHCHQGALGKGLTFDVIGPSLVRRVDWSESDLRMLSSKESDLGTRRNLLEVDIQHEGDIARSYLDINCGHCHNPTGLAGSSGLFLTSDIKSSKYLGICKPVVASGNEYAGDFYDVVPGQSSRSVLLHRIKSVEAGVKMPELGRMLMDTQGLQWVSSWIDNLEGACRGLN